MTAVARNIQRQAAQAAINAQKTAHQAHRIISLKFKKTRRHRRHHKSYHVAHEQDDVIQRTMNTYTLTRHHTLQAQPERPGQLQHGWHQRLHQIQARSAPVYRHFRFYHGRRLRADSKILHCDGAEIPNRYVRQLLLPHHDTDVQTQSQKQNGQRDLSAVSEFAPK